jgi:tartrate dehydratase beta subunit/fumarate hydratase class I family protein
VNIRGAAQVLANTITNVKNVHMLKELGAPEAIWEFEVKNFPAVVTMDSHGHSLHKNILGESEAALKKLIGLT